MGQEAVTDPRKAGRQAFVNRKQTSLHRFSVKGATIHNVYQLLGTPAWMRSALDNVLARPGSDSAGIDGKTRAHYRAETAKEELVAEIVMEIRSKAYHLTVVRRVEPRCLVAYGHGPHRPSESRALNEQFKPDHEHKRHRDKHGLHRSHGDRSIIHGVVARRGGNIIEGNYVRSSGSSASPSVGGLCGATGLAMYHTNIPATASASTHPQRASSWLKEPMCKRLGTLSPPSAQRMPDTRNGDSEIRLDVKTEVDHIAIRDRVLFSF